MVSRVHGREYLLSDEKREVFRDLLRRVAGFCGVDVLTFCFMENHFHLLIPCAGEAGGSGGWGVAAAGTADLSEG